MKRLILNINSRGTVLSVNNGAPKALFGFNPSDVIGRPIAAFVNVFGQWRRQFGGEESLLALLANRASDKGETAWRVGVHLPVADADIGTTQQVCTSASNWATLRKLRKLPWMAY